MRQQAKNRPVASFLRFTIRGKEVREILRRFAAVTNIRITFYDPEDRKLDDYAGHADYSYCRNLRRNPAFDRKCEACDVANLSLARQGREAHVYRCHHGLIEGIIPLYDRNGRYLGALAFGQIRARDGVPPAMKEDLRDLFAELPARSHQEVLDLASLLKCIADYLINHQLVTYQGMPWAEAVRLYVRNHQDSRISLEDLAAVAGKSVSFVTHEFKRHMGCSARQYIERERMASARERLLKGEPIKKVAADLGFCDEFYFSRVFKRYYGLPPATYLRRDEQGPQNLPVF
jgi:AraC-like DNA-binding protein